MTHQLPPLPYAYNALEPYLDEQTLHLHHDKHHLAYVNGLNTAEQKLAEAREKKDFTLVKHWERELAFHGAGHYLHTMLWENMKPAGGGQPTGDLMDAINSAFGSYEHFAGQFKAASIAVEASGWGLLTWNTATKSLQIMTAEKHQDLTQWVNKPLLACDVWEHAYYLKYQNNRAGWVEAFLTHLVNLDDVARRMKQV